MYIDFQVSHSTLHLMGFTMYSVFPVSYGIFHYMRCSMYSDFPFISIQSCHNVPYFAYIHLNIKFGFNGILGIFLL